MKNNVKKGQAALEFMMTYGWAILVVLAAIGALSYFGVLNPSRFTPETCLASSGFSCPGKPMVNPTNITFSLVNGLGYKVTLSAENTTVSSTLVGYSCDPTNVQICNQGVTACTPAASKDIEDGAGATVILTGCNFANANVVKGDVKFSYVNSQSKLVEDITVTVTGKVKS